MQMCKKSFDNSGISWQNKRKLMFWFSVRVGELQAGVLRVLDIILG